MYLTVSFRLLVRKAWCLLILVSFSLFSVPVTIFWFQSPNKRPKTCYFDPKNVIHRTRCLHWVNCGPVTLAGAGINVICLGVRSRSAHPSNFTAGEIYYHLVRWNEILEGHKKRDEILSYVKFGVDVCDFFLPFKGNFQGTNYDSAFPPSVKFSNNKSCAGFEDFISDTILERLANGSLSISGKFALFVPHTLLCR